MRSIRLGEEQIELPRSALKLLGVHTWGFEWNGLDYCVGGAPEGRSDVRVAFAKRVAFQSDEFIGEANDYLSHFIDLERVSAVGSWIPDGFDFARNPVDPVDEFEVLMVIEGDYYGVWRVRFKDCGEPLGFLPVEFSRRAT